MKLLSFALLLSGFGTLSAGNYNYSEVIGLSLLFYEAQRTGVLPSTNRIPWRGDSFVTDIGQNGEDLTGGYFDGKFECLTTIRKIIFLKFKQLETMLKYAILYNNFR
jgi:hypothetical protein